MFEYKSDVAVLHGAFLSALEQLKNSENETKNETVHVDLCGLSDDCLIKACRVLTEAITCTCVEAARKGSSANCIEDTIRRLHAAIFNSLLSYYGFTSSQSSYFEAVENIFPKIDWTFYYSLIESANLKTYFVEVASFLQDDMCIFVLNKALQHIIERERESLLCCVQEIILKKYLFHSVKSLKNIDISTIDQYGALLKDTCKVFSTVWPKYRNNDKTVEQCTSFLLGALTILQTLCDIFLEHLAISFSSVAEMANEDTNYSILGILEWCHTLISEIYAVVAHVDELWSRPQSVDHLCENYDARVLKVVEESRDLLEILLYCASYCGLGRNLKGLDTFEMICECLRNMCSLYPDPKEIMDAYDSKIKVQMERVNGLKKIFNENGGSENYNITHFWREIYLRAEQETLNELMRCCISCEEDTCRVNLIEVLLANFENLQLSCQQNLLRQRLEMCQKSGALKLPDFSNALTKCLNQAAVGSKDIFQEILKLSLQSPDDTTKRVVMQAVANSGQIEILVQMLRVLHPVCVFHPISTSNTLLVDILNNLFSSDLTEKQLQNLLSTVKLLLSVDTNEETLKIEEFLHRCILPHFHTKTSTIMLEMVLQLFQHTCKLTRSATWNKSIATVPVVFCLCQLIDHYVYQGDGNRKGQVLQALTAFKEVALIDSTLLGSKTMPWTALSSVGKLHALDFFNFRKFHELPDIALILMLGSEDLKENISGANPHHQYSLLAACFTQVLPHLTVLEWEILCSFALNILNSQDVKAFWTIVVPENLQFNASEAFLVRCVTDAVILISEHRTAPVSWSYVLYCYSLILQRIVASNSDLTVVILCEVCRLASALTENTANHLLVTLLELSKSVHTNKLVSAAVNAIPHGNIRASLSEISSRS